MLKIRNKRLLFRVGGLIVSIVGFYTFQWGTDLFIRGFGGGVSATTVLICARDFIARRKDRKYFKVEIIMMLIIYSFFLWSMFSLIKLEKELQKQYPSLYNQVSPE